MKTTVSSINPFSGYLAAGSGVERAQAAEKSRQIRRRQQLEKNIAQQDDALEHQVESSDTVTGANGEQQRKREEPHQEQNDAAPEDDRPHVDVTG